MALRHGGVGVQEMADELGMARNSLSRWLSDRGRPRTAFLKMWALRTGVPYEWLATGREPDDEPDGGNGLPRLDSNQQPSGYTTSLVTRLPAQRSARRRRIPDGLEEAA